MRGFSGRPAAQKSEKEESITRLIKAIRRGNDHFVNLLIFRDRLTQAGADLTEAHATLKRLDADITKNEQQLSALGYVPRHKEKANVEA